MFRGKDLAGTRDIPLGGDCVYVEAERRPRGLNDNVDALVRSIWPDGRSWPIKSTARHVTHGRTVLGNPVERFNVFMGRMSEIRTLWKQGGWWSMGRPRRSTAQPWHAITSRSPS